MSGGWDRDLDLDLDTVRDWGAAAIVTLLEPDELKLPKVERLGEEVLRRKMSWFHLPIVDVSTPDERFSRHGTSPARGCVRCCAAALTCWPIAAEGLDGPA